MRWKLARLREGSQVVAGVGSVEETLINPPGRPRPGKPGVPEVGKLGKLVGEVA